MILNDVSVPIDIATCVKKNCVRVMYTLGKKKLSNIHTLSIMCL